MPFRLHLPITRATSLPKKRKRPSADSLHAAAARLDAINKSVPGSRISRFLEMFSSDSEDGDEEEDGYEHVNADECESEDENADVDKNDDDDDGIDVDMGEENEENEGDNDTDCERHPRVDIPQRYPEDDTDSRRYRRGLFLKRLATNASRNTDPVEKQTRKCPIDLSSGNELEEIMKTHSRTFTQPDIAKDKDDGVASGADSPPRNPFKKAKLGHQNRQSN